MDCGFFLYIYAVEEEKTDVITGTDGEDTYAAAVSGDAESGFVVTNTHTPVQDPDDPTPDDPDEPDDPDDPTPDDPEPAATFTITYDANGGTFENGAKIIMETHPAGAVITIPGAPARKGYTFLYWKGSQYDPGDKYKVEADHVFTAQWEKDENSDPSDDDDPSDSSDPDDPSGDSDSSDHGGGKGVPTGDSNDPVPWIVLLAVSLLGLAGAGIMKKRR